MSKKLSDLQIWMCLNTELVYKVKPEEGEIVVTFSNTTMVFDKNGKFIDLGDRKDGTSI